MPLECFFILDVVDKEKSVTGIPRFNHYTHIFVKIVEKLGRVSLRSPPLLPISTKI
jgi:hypothetical protein